MSIRRRHCRHLIVLLSIWLGLWEQSLRAEPTYGLPDSLSEQATASILIATPSNEEIYTLYGHAGLRIEDAQQGLDVTFNYGIFNFDDDFVFRFVQGKTDYIVLPQATSEYLKSYVGRGSGVRELVLAVDVPTIREMWSYLLHNIQPENRVYRYNFFYDNCATRPVAILSEALARAGKRQGRDTALDLDKVAVDRTTWRTEINRLEGNYPWLVLGTDLALGAPTDAEISARELMFLPHYIELILSQATVRGATYAHPVRQLRTYGQQQTVSRESRWVVVHPIAVALLILLLCFFGAFRMMRGSIALPNTIDNRRSSFPKLFDILLWSLVGLVGVILLYIGLGTEHPNTWPNYNILVFNPLLLVLGVPILALCSSKKVYFFLHFFNFVQQSGFILISALLPQHFNVVVYIIALSLGVLSIGRIVEYRRLQAV